MIPGVQSHVASGNHFPLKKHRNLLNHWRNSHSFSVSTSIFFYKLLKPTVLMNFNSSHGCAIPVMVIPEWQVILPNLCSYANSTQNPETVMNQRKGRRMMCIHFLSAMNK